MFKLVNPWVLLVALAAIVGSFLYGMNVGGDRAEAKQAKLIAVIAEVEAKAQQGAATEIAKIKITQTTIRQRAESTIREKVIYTKCVNDESIVGLLDASRAGSPPPEPPSRSKLP